MAIQEGNPTDEIDFGSRSSWMELYRERHTCVKEFGSLALAFGAFENVLLRQRDDAIQQAFGILHSEAPAPAPGEDFFTAQLNRLSDKEARARAAAANIDEGQIKSSVEYLELQNAYTANTNRYDRVQARLHARELSVGQQYRGEPPLYIARAIGSDYPPPLSDVWTRVRGAIEVFRFVTGEKRPNITLGPGIRKPWSSDTMDHTVSDVQRIQTLQIALAPDPISTAGEFGRLDTIATIGEPPLSERHNFAFKDGTWLQAALKHIQLSEPPADGLLIDRGHASS